DVIAPLAQPQPLVNKIAVCAQDEDATFGQVRLKILNYPQGFPFRQVGHQRTDPDQVEFAADLFPETEVEHKRVNIEYFFDRVNCFWVSINGNDSGEGKARLQPSQNPAEAARVIEDMLDLTNVAATSGQGIMDKPECTGTDLDVMSIIAFVHAVAGSKHSVHVRENSLLSVQLHLFGLEQPRLVFIAHSC